MFAGTPRPHKGVELVSETLCEMHDDEFIFLMVGPQKHGIFESANEILGDQCIIMQPIPYEQMPKLLTAVDIVTIMQKDNEYSNSQIPAKLLDAMAMEKIIIATNVSDISNILGVGKADKRGIVVKPNSKDDLKKALLFVKNNFEDSLAMGIKARTYYLKHACIAANAEKLQEIIS